MDKTIIKNGKVIPNPAVPDDETDLPNGISIKQIMLSPDGKKVIGLGTDNVLYTFKNDTWKRWH